MISVILQFCRAFINTIIGYRSKIGVDTKLYIIHACLLPILQYGIAQLLPTKNPSPFQNVAKSCWRVRPTTIHGDTVRDAATRPVPHESPRSTSRHNQQTSTSGDHRSRLSRTRISVLCILLFSSLSNP